MSFLLNLLIIEAIRGHKLSDVHDDDFENNTIYRWNVCVDGVDVK